MTLWCGISPFLTLRLWHKVRMPVLIVAHVCRKNAVELELAKCKMDMMSLNSQLLDAIQQKLNLSQQLEAWQVNEPEA